MSDSRTDRGQATSRAISEAALSLFRERGYDATTMREVADRAGVSVGNAYYYFESKDHLAQSYYASLMAQHAESAANALQGSAKFEDRLRIVLTTWLDLVGPDHEFLRRFLRTAADPESPLSPLSEQSAPSREANLALMDDVVVGSSVRLSAELRQQLPYLLWLGQLGVTLFWAYDTSGRQRRTRLLVTRITPLLGRLLSLTRVPGFNRLADDIAALVARLRQP